jgi:hypothetical protein
MTRRTTKQQTLNPLDIFSDAWQIAWKNKILWAFGFFAGLYIGSNKNSSFNIQSGAWLFQNIGSIFSNNTWITIAMGITGVVFWIIGTLARVSLVKEVVALDVKKHKPVISFIDSLRSSSKSLISVLLMQFIVFLPILAIRIVTYVFSQPLEKYFKSAITLPQNFSGVFGSILLVTLGTLLITLLLIFIDAFAFRGIVLDELGVKDSIKTAIQIISEHLKSTFLLSVICAIVGAIYAFVVSMVLSPFLLLMMGFMIQNVSQCAAYQGNFQAMANCVQQTGTNPTIIVVSILASLIGAALFSVWVTIQSASFTLAYKKVTESKKPT